MDLNTKIKNIMLIINVVNSRMYTTAHMFGVSSILLPKVAFILLKDTVKTIKAILCNTITIKNFNMSFIPLMA